MNLGKLNIVFKYSLFIVRIFEFFLNKYLISYNYLNGINIFKCFSIRNFLFPFLLQCSSSARQYFLMNNSLACLLFILFPFSFIFISSKKLKARRLKIYFIISSLVCFFDFNFFSRIFINYGGKSLNCSSRLLFLVN